MLIPCEIAVKYALPYIRAMLANELMSRHHLTQMQTAKYLELNQSAISLYHQRLRGNWINLQNDNQIQLLISKQANFLVKNNPCYTDKLGLFCEVCKVVRTKGYLCSLHRGSDSTVDKACNFCKTNVCPGLEYYIKK